MSKRGAWDGRDKDGIVMFDLVYVCVRVFKSSNPNHFVFLHFMWFKVVVTVFRLI